MTGKMLLPGAGRQIAFGGVNATLKVAGGPDGDGALCSTFEMRVPPGFDVGAHVHTHGEELFYVLEGTLDLLAFEPAERTAGDWHDWRTRDGQRFLRGGPGSLLHVPAGTPHAFANLSDQPARLLFQAAPSGHEFYFDELAELLATGTPADPAAVAELRSRHDIHQLTDLVAHRF